MKTFCNVEIITELRFQFSYNVQQAMSRMKVDLRLKFTIRKIVIKFSLF